MRRAKSRPETSKVYEKNTGNSVMRLRQIIANAISGCRTRGQIHKAIRKKDWALMGCAG
jgi:hypothetical protein